MTKGLIGTADMQPMAQGILALGMPAGDVVPVLGKVDVREGFGANGQPRTRAAKRAITLRHLLTHTAGFGYEAWNANVVRYQQAMGLPRIGSCQNAALGLPLLFDPGDRWEYGINIDWVGKIVEAVSGRNLGSYLSANMFG